MDIIIPTLLKANKEVFSYLLTEINKSDIINKIIIIDNSLGQFKQDYTNLITSKFEIFDDENLFVNPAWN